MARRLRIGVDVDEVLVDFISAFRQEAETLLGTRLNPEPGTWEFTEGNWRLTPDELAKVWNKIRSTENWYYLYLRELPFVVQNLAWLTDNHDVYFITSRPETAGFTAQKQTQMMLHDMGVQFPTVIVTHNKGPISSALNLEIFVDDRFENLDQIEYFSLDNMSLFLMNQSHNINQDIPKDWIRVVDFKDFIEKVEQLSNG